MKVGGAAVGCTTVGGLVTCATDVIVMQPEATSSTAIPTGSDRNLVRSVVALSVLDNGQISVR
jgi:hypothetical protein